MNSFCIETESFPDDTRVVAITGELDMYTTPPFERQIIDALEDGAARVVVDLSGCELLDSTALGILVRVKKRLADGEQRLVLVAASQWLLRIFHITGFDRAFTIVPTRDVALNGAGRV